MDVAKAISAAKDIRSVISPIAHLMDCLALLETNMRALNVYAGAAKLDEITALLGELPLTMAQGRRINGMKGSLPTTVASAPSRRNLDSADVTSSNDSNGRRDGQRKMKATRSKSKSKIDEESPQPPQQAQQDMALPFSTDAFINNPCTIFDFFLRDLLRQSSDPSTS